MLQSKLFSFQVSVLADEILKNVEYDALRIVFNKFSSVVSFVPTTSTVLSPEVTTLHQISNSIVILYNAFLSLWCHLM